MDYTAHYESPLGSITLGSDGKALIGLWFDGQKHFANVLDPVHEKCSDLPVFRETCRWLDEYFRGRKPQFTPPFVLRGSDFRKRVWLWLLNIPYGQTVTYGQLASSLGCKSAQAIGAAVGHNPLTLIIPCHRVVGTNGSLTGYAGGIDKKVQLLQMEGALMHDLKAIPHSDKWEFNQLLISNNLHL